MPKLMILLEEFEQAVRDHEFRGTYTPEDACEIAVRYQEAKLALVRAMQKAVQRKKERQND